MLRLDLASYDLTTFIPDCSHFMYLINLIFKFFNRLVESSNNLKILNLIYVFIYSVEILLLVTKINKQKSTCKHTL